MERPTLAYFSGADRTGPVSVLAVASLCLSIASIPCITGHVMVLTFVPADVFNSVDLSYRGIFWNAVAALPALATFILSCASAYRVRRSKCMRGADWPSPVRS